jgi:hypothetical protein
MTDLSRAPEQDRPGFAPMTQEPTADVVTLATLDALEDLADGTIEPQSYGLMEDLEPQEEDRWGDDD